MKVLWLVNTIFPYPAVKINRSVSPFGGWANSLFNSLEKEENILFCIVATYNGKELKKFMDKSTIYYLIPNKKENIYNYKLKKYWKIIIEDFNPDIIHIHGTEYPKSLPLIEQYPYLNYVVSIQGFLNSYARVNDCNLSFSTLLKNLTIRDILKPKSGLLTRMDIKKRAIYEKKIIENIHYVIGRTTWDKSQVMAINPNIKYYLGEENLRKCFYDGKWNINQINRHTLFFSQAQSMIKGFYIFIEAIRILKVKYPDVKAVIAGNNILDNKFKSKLKRQSYTKYISKLINKYNLQDNIEFTGFLNAEEYKNKLLKSHVYVQSSSVENSSNSLGEAMILGLPCVASNVGGTSDMLIDKLEGFLYPYTEPELLAYYIEQFFESDELCLEKGNNARKHALKRHDWNSNAKQTINIYKDILKNSDKK